MMTIVKNRPEAAPLCPLHPQTMGPSYPLLAIAILSLFAAIFGIFDGLRQIENAYHDIQKGYQAIGAAETILAVARNLEAGQLSYLLSGEEHFLETRTPIGMASAASAGKELEKQAMGNRKADIARIRNSFLAQQSFGARRLRIAQEQGLGAARNFDRSGQGKALMDRLSADIETFNTRERRRLRTLQAEGDLAYRNALLQTVIASFALIFAGALFYAVIRRAQNDVAENADRALQANRRFEATFEQSAVGMIHLTPEGDPIIVNAAIAGMTGYSRSEILAAPRGTPAHPLALLMSEDRGHRLPSGATSDIRWEHWTQTKSGAKLCLSILLSAVRAADGSIAFLSGLARDITAQRMAELELRESEDRLHRLQEELAHIGRVNSMGRMAAAIAHEINQPLTAITNYMSLGQRLTQGRSETENDMLQIMQQVSEQARRAGDILARVRGFIARRDAVRSTENLAHLIRSAIDLALLGADKTRISIEHVQAPFHFRVNVDPIQIQQVLMILIRNAIDAGKDRPTLSIVIRKQWDPDRRSVAIFVADDGPGLTADMVARLFQPFTTSKPGNMDMGLHIANRLLAYHGGQISCATSHQGATFRVDLPVLELQPLPSDCPAAQRPF